MKKGFKLTKSDNLQQKSGQNKGMRHPEGDDFVPLSLTLLPTGGEDNTFLRSTETNFAAFNSPSKSEISFPPQVGNMKHAAFTLAEVLITLAIIGVVAAMTLPSVIQNQQKRSLEVATKKFYTNMSQAVKQYMADEGVDDLRNTPLSCQEEGCPEGNEIINNFVTKYLKVAKTCKGENRTNCFADKYTTMAHEDSTTPDVFLDNGGQGEYDSYVLPDGMSLQISFYAYNSPITIYVDINGKKGPNRVGYDLWSMSLFYDGTIDESGVTPECRQGKQVWCTDSYGEIYYCAKQEKREYRFENDCKAGYGGCFGHFLSNGFKFDY